MYKQVCLSLMVLFAFTPLQFVCGAGGPAEAGGGSLRLPSSEQYHKTHTQQQHSAQHAPSQHHHHSSGGIATGGSSNIAAVGQHYHSGSGHVDHRNSYNLLSEAMSQAVSNEFSSMGGGSGSADGACHADDLDCYSGTVQDRLGLEAIATLHRQLDDDDNGNIDLSESDDFLREELKYDSGYEKRQKAFHFNDDMHISVKELWEAWLRSEVHNWTIEQTTDWLAQSVQLPQYVELFKQHKVTGAALPRLAVNNMHYVSNVLGIKDPIHKQKIALKAMDVVLFGPPRETGTRWKDYILVTLLLSAIIGCWYAYQQNKNAKRHLRRMAQDMEGLQRAEQSLQEMQKELERARMEQENVATEKLDLERRLKEAPALSSSNSDLEVQKLKKEIEMLRTELSRAEIELVDNCWAPPPQLQSWLQYTYELESKNHMKKRISAEKQLQSAREACEKLRKKRSSLVGAFVSTHGKSIDDVDRSIVEARNSLGEVTNELQERLHRWKQIENCLGLNIVNNNGLPYLENVLYSRGNGSTKSSRGRMTSSTDDLDDDSVQGFLDNYSRGSTSVGHIGSSSANTIRDDSSCSDDGADTQSVQFYLGAMPTPIANALPPSASSTPQHRVNTASTTTTTHSLDNMFNHIGNNHVTNHPTPANANVSVPLAAALSSSASAVVAAAAAAATTNSTTHTQIASGSGLVPIIAPPSLPTSSSSSPNALVNLANDSIHNVLEDESHHSSPSASSERSIPVPPRTKKPTLPTMVPTTITTTPPPPPPPPSGPIGRAPQPPPRKSAQSEMCRSQSTDLVPMEIYGKHSNSINYLGHQQLNAATAAAAATAGIKRGGIGKMVKQHSSASQQSTSSTSSSVQSAPTSAGNGGNSNETCIGYRQQTLSSGFSLDQLTATATDHNRQQQQQHHHHHEQRDQSQQHTQQQQQQLLQPHHYITAYNSLSHGEKTTAASSASAAASSHRDTEMDQQLQLLRSQPTATTDSAASSECGIELKKRRRKLRFPFGGKKSESSSSRSNSKSK